MWARRILLLTFSLSHTPIYSTRPCQILKVRPEEAQKLWPVDNKFELAKGKGQHQRTMAIVLILANLK